MRKSPDQLPDIHTIVYNAQCVADADNAWWICMHQNWEWL